MYRSYALGDQPPWLSRYISSLSFDVDICPYVLDVLKVHALHLASLGVIGREDAEKIVKALEDFDCSSVQGPYEDVHEAIEYYLIQKLGSAAKWINLGKSRNDQVATAIRMRLKEEIMETLSAVWQWANAVTSKALAHLNDPFPAFTHLQPAQPTTFGHYLLSFVEDVLDACELMLSAYDDVDKCPMGSAAVAGSTVPVDRFEYCRKLCFEDVALNTIYATGSRTFALAAMSALLTLSVPLLKLAEDMFVFSTPAFALVRVHSHHAGTSSIMPHKRNPSTLEVARAELSKLMGDLAATFAILKGMPSGYVLDYQQLTPVLWPAFKRVRLALLVLSDFVEKVELGEGVERALNLPLLAADVAEYLSLKKGMPFREAYARVAKAVKEVGYDMRAIAEKVLGEEAEEVLKEPLAKRTAAGAPGNVKPLLDKVKRKMDALARVLARKYELYECPRPLNS